MTSGIRANWFSGRYYCRRSRHAFWQQKLREQRSMQYELEKSKAELADYREELTNHFAQSAELLDNMARDYRQLYQHMAKAQMTCCRICLARKIRLPIS